MRWYLAIEVSAKTSRTFFLFFLFSMHHCYKIAEKHTKGSSVEEVQQHGRGHITAETRDSPVRTQPSAFPRHRPRAQGLG